MRLVAVAILLAVSSGNGQAANCKDPQSNAEMKICAAEEWKKADAELNLAFDKAIAAAREDDANAKSNGAPAGRRSSEAMLRDAQRAWIAFRDANCAYQYQLYFGGSHAPLAHSICMGDMTTARLKELRQLPGGDDFER
jgi:uncharacterized protein YecT (DUF1311 family)